MKYRIQIDKQNTFKNKLLQMFPPPERILKGEPDQRVWTVFHQVCLVKRRLPIQPHSALAAVIWDLM